MPKFRFIVTRDTSESAMVTIDAADIEEAHDKALSSAMDLEWEPDNCVGRRYLPDEDDYEVIDDIDYADLLEKCQSGPHVEGFVGTVHLGDDLLFWDTREDAWNHVSHPLGCYSINEPIALIRTEDPCDELLLHAVAGDATRGVFVFRKSILDKYEKGSFEILWTSKGGDEVLWTSKDS